MLLTRTHLESGDARRVDIGETALRRSTDSDHLSSPGEHRIITVQGRRGPNPDFDSVVIIEAGRREEVPTRRVGDEGESLRRAIDEPLKLRIRVNREGKRRHRLKCRHGPRSTYLVGTNNTHLRLRKDIYGIYDGPRPAAAVVLGAEDDGVGAGVKVVDSTRVRLRPHTGRHGITCGVNRSARESPLPLRRIRIPKSAKRWDVLHDYRLARTDPIERHAIKVGLYARKKPIRENIQKLCICDSGVTIRGSIFDEVIPALRRIPDNGCTCTCGVEEVTSGLLPVGRGADGLGERDFGVRTTF
jgi:hypothetical protein